MTRRERVVKLLEGIQSLYKAKNNDYSDAYIRASEVMMLIVPDQSQIVTLSQRIAYHHIYIIVCKLIRIANLKFTGTPRRVRDESIASTWRDNSLYSALMAEVEEDSENLDNKEKSK
jgi:hypothetical protein